MICAFSFLLLFPGEKRARETSFCFFFFFLRGEEFRANGKILYGVRRPCFLGRRRGSPMALPSSSGRLGGKPVVVDVPECSLRSVDRLALLVAYATFATHATCQKERRKDGGEISRSQTRDEKNNKKKKRKNVTFVSRSRAACTTLSEHRNDKQRQSGSHTDERSFKMPRSRSFLG